jgi:hypothetical protein
VFDFGLDENSFWHEPDFLLADLVSSMANKGGMQLGVTLMVKGVVLTGTLVSEREYLAALSEMFTSQAKKSVPTPSKAELRAIEEAFDFNMLTEDSYPGDDDLPDMDLDDGAEEDRDDEVDDEDEFPIGPTPVRHLHLKDPTILLPQPAITFAHGEISIMRLRLTAIDGWMLGRAAVVDPDGPAEILH